MIIEDEIKDLKLKITHVENLLNNGDDITLPIRNISVAVEELKEVSKKHTDIIAIQQGYINKINQESIKARNQIVYMFLMIFATLVGKLLIPYITGHE